MRDATHRSIGPTPRIGARPSPPPAPPRAAAPGPGAGRPAPAPAMPNGRCRMHGGKRHRAEDAARAGEMPPGQLHHGPPLQGGGRAAQARDARPPQPRPAGPRRPHDLQRQDRGQEGQARRRRGAAPRRQGPGRGGGAPGNTGCHWFPIRSLPRRTPQTTQDASHVHSTRHPGLDPGPIVQPRASSTWTPGQARGGAGVWSRQGYAVPMVNEGRTLTLPPLRGGPLPLP